MVRVGPEFDRNWPKFARNRPKLGTHPDLAKLGQGPAEIWSRCRPNLIRGGRNRQNLGRLRPTVSRVQPVCPGRGQRSPKCKCSIWVECAPSGRGGSSGTFARPHSARSIQELPHVRPSCSLRGLRISTPHPAGRATLPNMVRRPKLGETCKLAAMGTARAGADEGKQICRTGLRLCVARRVVAPRPGGMCDITLESGRRTKRSRNKLAYTSIGEKELEVGRNQPKLR